MLFSDWIVLYLFSLLVFAASCSVCASSWQLVCVCSVIHPFLTDVRYLAEVSGQIIYLTFRNIISPLNSCDPHSTTMIFNSLCLCSWLLSTVSWLLSTVSWLIRAVFGWCFHADLCCFLAGVCCFSALCVCCFLVDVCCILTGMCCFLAGWAVHRLVYAVSWLVCVVS